MKQLSRPSVDGQKAERALKKAVARVMDDNRRLGYSVAVMHHNKAVIVSPDTAVKVARETPESYQAKPSARRKAR